MADNKFTYTIDSSDIDSELTDVPAVIQLNSSCGKTSFDSSAIFDELTGGKDEYTKLLIHADEADESTTIVDSSDSAHTITANGDAKVKDFNADGNEVVNFSGHFNGVDAYLTIPDHTDWPEESTDAWTIECWFFPTNVEGVNSGYLFSSSLDNNTTSDIFMLTLFDGTHATLAGKLSFIWLTGGTPIVDITASDAINFNDWNHVALGCDGSSNVTMRLNGTSVATSSTTITTATRASDIHIGCTAWGRTYFFKGYIAGYAVHKDEIYTSNFTPPLTIAEMTNDANTALFLDFAELDQGELPATIVDSSASAHTVTNVSSKVSGCTFWWNGAIDLDGTGDYLTVSDHVDFPDGGEGYTISGFISANSDDSDNDTIYSQSTTNSTYVDRLLMYVDKASDRLVAILHRTSSTNRVVLASANDTVSYNKLHHFEASFDGIETWRLFLDGSLVDSATYTPSAMTLGSDVHIGGNSYNSSDLFQGYIGELHISKGIARHTSSFIPPTKQNRGSWERIKVTDADDNTLYTEIENWDTVNKRATLHVKVPTINSNVNTQLLLDYNSTNSDNSSKIGIIGSTPGKAVWDSNFVFVSHQAQDPSGSAPQILDSTSNAKHGTSYGTMLTADLIDGVTGKMLDYDGTDDYTNHGYNVVHDITDTLTLEVSFTPNTLLDSGLTVYPGLLSRQNDPTDAEDTYGFYINIDGKLQIGSQGGNIQSTKTSWAADQNFIVAGTYNATGLIGDLFVDGVKETLATDNYDTITGSTNNLVIGKSADTGDFFPGAMGEVRISNVVRSDDWIGITNLSLTDTLFTVAEWDLTIRVALVQTYTLYNRFHRLLLDQLYSLTLPHRLELDATYSLKLTAILIQYYNDVPRLRVALHQWYWDAVQNRTKLVSEYGDCDEFRVKLDATYHLYKRLIRKLEQNYSIAGTELRQSLIQNFDIKSVDALRVKMEQSYALLEGTTTLDSPQPTAVTGIESADGSIEWTDNNINFNSFNINAGMGKYVITCPMELSSIADYFKVPFLTDIKLSYGGTDFEFFVKNRSKSTAYGSGVYSIELESHTAKLDTPYIRPLTASDNIDSDTYASTIVSVMAAKANITVDYQIIDWLIKSSAISVVGKTPLEVIRTIVNSIGAIVQSKPNGDMLIISKYPISPPAWSGSTPDRVLLLSDDIDGIQESLEEREGYNAFSISEQSSTTGNISLEVVDVDSTTKIAKGFRVPFSDGTFPLETSGGSSVHIDKYPYPVEEQVPDINGDEEWEIVEFIDWQGSTSKPIYSIVSIDWIQDELTDEIPVPPLSVLDINESGTLTVMDTDSVPSESLLRIKYVTKYWKWTIKGPVDIPIQIYVPEIEE